MQQETAPPITITLTEEGEPRFGCSMLTRIRELPWGLQYRPQSRCSLGFALHDEGEVALCRGVDGPAACWKATANWRVAPAPGPGPKGERPTDPTAPVAETTVAAVAEVASAAEGLAVTEAATADNAAEPTSNRREERRQRSGSRSARARAAAAAAEATAEAAATNVPEGVAEQSADVEMTVSQDDLATQPEQRADAQHSATLDADETPTIAATADLLAEAATAAAAIDATLEAVEATLEADPSPLAAFPDTAEDVESVTMERSEPPVELIAQPAPAPAPALARHVPPPRQGAFSPLGGAASAPRPVAAAPENAPAVEPTPALQPAAEVEAVSSVPLAHEMTESAAPGMSPDDEAEANDEVDAVVAASLDDAGADADAPQTDEHHAADGDTTVVQPEAASETDDEDDNAGAAPGDEREPNLP